MLVLFLSTFFFLGDAVVFVRIWCAFFGSSRWGRMQLGLSSATAPVVFITDPTSEVFFLLLSYRRFPSMSHRAVTRAPNAARKFSSPLALESVDLFSPLHLGSFYKLFGDKSLLLSVSPLLPLPFALPRMRMRVNGYRLPMFFRHSSPRPDPSLFFFASLERGRRYHPR